MTLKTKLLLGVMTPMERARGRYMRAPDHPTGEQGGEEGSSGGDGSQAAGKSDPDAGLTTAQKLEKEFGQEITPATDDGSDSSTGNEGEDEDEDNGDADNADDQDSDGEADEGGAEGEEGEGEEGDSGNAGPKKNRAQERISELTADSRFHQREAEKWRKVAEEHGYVEGSDSAAQLPEEPDPSKYTYGENDLDYIKDRAKFDAKVETLTEQASARFKSEAAALDAKWSGTLAEHIADYPDYEEVVVQGAKDQKWHCPPVIAVGIKDSPHGVAISYKLAKDPAESERIAKLSPLEQAREFGKLEKAEETGKTIAELEAKIAKLEGKGDAAGKKPPKIVSSAPNPPKRTGRGGGGAIAETNADTDDFSAFERMADAKLGMKKG